VHHQKVFSRCYPLLFPLKCLCTYPCGGHHHLFNCFQGNLHFYFLWDLIGIVIIFIFAPTCHEVASTHDVIISTGTRLFANYSSSLSLVSSHCLSFFSILSLLKWYAWLILYCYLIEEMHLIASSPQIYHLFIYLMTTTLHSNILSSFPLQRLNHIVSVFSGEFLSWLLVCLWYFCCVQ